MASALLAKDFGSNHPVAVVHVLNYVGICALGIKTGPTAVGVKLSIAHKKFGATTGTVVVARLEMLVVRTAAGVLCSFLTEYAELLRGEF